MGHNPRPTLRHPTLDTVLVTAVLHALSDETRLSIVRTLHAEPDGRACGTFPVNLAPSTLSHHFKILREAGLIRQEDRGTQRWTVLRRPEFDARFPGFLNAVIAATEITPARS
ncbi:ArsR family transcriptional regulator [Cryobacterium sp. MLB-32]|nr:ArsR family transcriptional regulator [Cryobacterium sp. MLB-32]